MAVSTGQLAIPLPSGDVVVARYERDFTNDRGDWTFVGKVETAVGEQSMVITFGAEGVFGVIPSPSGHLLQVQSGAGGQAWVEPIDDLIPPGMERKSFAPGRLGESAAHDHSQCYVVPSASLDPGSSTTDAANGRTPLTDEQAEAIAKSGTVVIDVLGIYTTGVIEERGSAAAAETYFHSLVELSNQAFVDSGIDARFRVVGLRQIAERTGRTNSGVLGDLSGNRLPGIDAVAEREALGADLVTVLRRYQSGDPSCGVAFLNGSGLRGDTVVDGSAFSVNACGGYVMAHEFGHNLGSMHDIETTFGPGAGAGGFGAYRYSFGYRQPGRFSTIMAYQAGGPWLGRFSDPRSNRCVGQACGIEDVVDNARSLRLMAPRIAGFRTGTPGVSVAVLPRTIVEGNTGTVSANITFSSSRPAPAGGVTIDWETQDGTAVAGWDYQPRSGRVVIPAGGTTVGVSVPVIGDEQIEASETIAVRLVSVVNAQIGTERAFITVQDDDPSGVVSGSIRFPAGSTPPTQVVRVSVSARMQDGTPFSIPAVDAPPPGFAFQIRAPVGAELDLTASLPSPFPSAVDVAGVRVRPQTTQDIIVPLTRSITGRLVYAAGDAPNGGQWVQARTRAPGSNTTRFLSVLANPPDFRFAFAVPDGQWARLDSGQPGVPSTALPQSRVLGVVTADLSADLEMARTVGVGFWQSDMRVSEGRGSQCVDVELTSPAAQAISVPVELVPGTAGVPADASLSISTGSALQIPAGSRFSSNVACVSAALDDLVEPAETATLRLGQPTNAILMSGAQELRVVITDAPVADPNQPLRITVGDAQLTEGNSGSTEALVPVTFSRPVPSGGLRMRLSTADGAAVSGQDYQNKSLLWDLPPGLSSAVFPIAVSGDRVDEPDETFFVRVTEASASIPTELADGEALVTVLNDDATPRLRVLDATVNEGDGGAQPLALRVALSHPAASTVTGSWSTGGGTAAAGSDYRAASGAFSIPAGQSTATLAVEALGDTTVESNETFNVTVAGVAGAVIDDGTAVVTITDDDVSGSPNLRIGDVSVAEGDSGPTAVVFPVTLSSPAGAAGVAFDVATVAQSAQAGSDFDALATQRVTIASGASSASIRVDVLGDTDVEADESFGLSITNVSGATLQTSAPRAVIRNDDARAAVPQLVAPADVSVTEGNSGAQTVRLAWTLSSPAPAGGVTFDIATVEGTAKAGEDFIALSTPVRIEAGQARAEVEVQINGDTTGELDEAFSVAAVNLKSALPATRAASIRVVNDDPRNRLSGRLIIEPGLVLPDVVRLNINDQSPSQFRSVEARAPDYTYEVLVTHASAVQVNAPTDLPAPAYANPSRGQVASVTGEVTLDIRILRGFTARGRVVFPAGSTLPPGVWVQARTPAFEFAFVYAHAPDFSFEITLRPGVVNCLGAQVAAPLLAPCTDIGVVQADVSRDVVVVIPPPLRARDDQHRAAENAAMVDMPVLANDVFDPSRLQSISIVRQPELGTASIDGRGTSTPTDDVVRYVPPRNWSGVAVVIYSLCESDRCSPNATATIRIAPAPFGGLDLQVSTQRGFRDVPLSGLRALPGVRFDATSLSAPVVGDLALGVDGTPETPWDGGRAGTSHVSGSLPGTSGSALPWQMFAEAAGLGGDVDLYLGEDLNGDGQPSENELRCTSAMSAAGERCELGVTVAAGGTGRYWAMLHNRGTSAQAGRLSRYEVPLLASDGSLVTTAPGILAAGESFPLRVQWDDPTLLGGESRVGYVQMILGGATQAVFPVKLTRTAAESTPLALESGVNRTLRLAGNGSHEQLFIDVPAGATRLLVTTASGSNVDVYLARVAPPAAGGAVPVIGAAPARSQAQASGTTASGNESVEVSNPAAGRWYVTPVNMTPSAATVVVRATVTGTAPTVRSGGYFNTGRGGHGLFLYPAGGEWAGLWYTYLQDRTPTWYYLQGAAPGANGIWEGDIYRATWVGDSRFLTIVGQATATPTGPDAFTFSYTLDGQMGSEAFSAFGRGCPTIGGAAADISQHYFDQSRSGTGYSAQVLTTPGPYEFYAMFVYDAKGVARFLVAEDGPSSAGASTIGLDQLTGFCPTCERSGPPIRTRVGSLQRTISGGRLTGITVDATFANGIPGVWRATDTLTMLDPQNRTQGCQ